MPMNKISKQETPEKITMLISTSAYHESVSVSVKAFLLAEKLNHHPTVTTHYNQVKVEVSTHDAGNKVTDLDRDYIAQLEAML
jgi:4a-hydroxytetrahydrobiopterin dehydratase